MSSCEQVCCELSVKSERFKLEENNRAQWLQIHFCVCLIGCIQTGCQADLALPITLRHSDKDSLANEIVTVGVGKGNGTITLSTRKLPGYAHSGICQVCLHLTGQSKSQVILPSKLQEDVRKNAPQTGEDSEI